MAALKSLNPAVVLAVLGAIALVGIVFLVVRVVKAKKTGGPVLGAMPDMSGPLGKLQAFLGNPLVHRALAHAVATAEATHHAALDAGIAKLLPGAVPFLPVINGLADKVDAAVSAKLGGDPIPVPATPGGVDLPSKIAAVEKLLADLKSHFGS